MAIPKKANPNMKGRIPTAVLKTTGTASLNVLGTKLKWWLYSRYLMREIHVNIQLNPRMTSMKVIEAGGQEMSEVDLTKLAEEDERNRRNLEGKDYPYNNVVNVLSPIPNILHNYTTYTYEIERNRTRTFTNVSE